MFKIVNKNIQMGQIIFPLKETPIMLVTRNAACDFYQDNFINIYLIKLHIREICKVSREIFKASRTPFFFPLVHLA